MSLRLRLPTHARTAAGDPRFSTAPRRGFPDRCDPDKPEADVARPGCAHRPGSPSALQNSVQMRKSGVRNNHPLGKTGYEGGHAQRLIAFVERRGCRNRPFEWRLNACSFRYRWTHEDPGHPCDGAAAAGSALNCRLKASRQLAEMGHVASRHDRCGGGIAMPAASPDLRKELNGAEEDGARARCPDLWRGDGPVPVQCRPPGDSQIAAVDGVLAHLVERVEAATVIQLSEALSTIDRAPVQTVRKLAFHEQPQVAAPVCELHCLTDADLLEMVKSRSPAASARDLRPQNPERSADRCADVIRRRHVSNALARNTGARFSECGYATLVGRAKKDEGWRKSSASGWMIQGSLLRELYRQGRRRRPRALPDGARPVARPKAQNAGAGHNGHRKAIDYTEAHNEVVVNKVEEC